MANDLEVTVIFAINRVNFIHFAVKQKTIQIQGFVFYIFDFIKHKSPSSKSNNYKQRTTNYD
ncbi:MAG: hypothetical protein JWR72_122 [Flavisolibacter sp.]|jgi:hypothetical protein|nr:hypothetical protein [Flavisolibacter sp.]